MIFKNLKFLFTKSLEDQFSFKEIRKKFLIDMIQDICKALVAVAIANNFGRTGKVEVIYDSDGYFYLHEGDIQLTLNTKPCFTDFSDFHYAIEDSIRTIKSMTK